MKKWLTNIYRNIYLFFSNLTLATKNVGDEIFTQVDNESSGISIAQDATQGTHALSKALLRGELTEEVKQLRYRTYKVDRESKKYKYYAPTLALKRKNGKDNKFISYDKSDGLDVITIQDCHPIGENVTDAIHQIEDGGRGKAEKYNIEIERNFVPRFRLEEFLKRLVVKRFDETHAILDFYFSMYPERFFRTSDDKSFRSKAFIHEIENIRDNGLRSDILLMEKLRFVTSHAYQQDDLMEFVFRNLWFKEVAEFDGCYILRFKASIEHNGYDLTASYYNKEMDEKYKNHEKKDLILDVSGNAPVETYVCADCGKVVTFDTVAMDNMPICEAREIDEENVETGDEWSTTEYFDMQLVEQTIGKKLCKNCLKKYIDTRGMDNLTKQMGL